MKNIFSLSISVTLLFTACKKDSDNNFNSNVLAELSVEFDNIAGGEDLQLNTGNYTNASGEVFNVSNFKYFVSNFKLTKADGSQYVVPQDSCYFLIDESDEQTHEPLLKVPEGEYTAISFVLGVDSLRNTMDISNRTGNLDPAGAANGMYWEWNSGYIFLKLEGNSPAASMGGTYMYHVGGFGGYSSHTINNLKTITLDLTARGTPKVKADKATNIHLMADVLKVFSGSNNISIATNPMVMFSDFSVNIANNYAGMFKHDHTEN